MILTERHQIKGTLEIVRLATASARLYNDCSYLMRTAWFAKLPQPNISALYKIFKENKNFKDLGNTKTAMQTIRRCLEDWSNFYKALKAFKKNPTSFNNHCPKPPKYKKKLAQVIFYNETIHKDTKRSKKYVGKIVPTNDCFQIKSDRPYKQVVITPKSFGFIIDVSYEITEQEIEVKIKQITKEQQVKDDVKIEDIIKEVMCIDLGVNNLCAITSDQIKTPILVNGRTLKSINQNYNKLQAEHRENCKKNKNGKFDNQYLTEKRYWRMENYMHHVSKFIVQQAIAAGVGVIIIGKNDGWKQNQNNGKKNNQNFQYIPYDNLIKKIKYKAYMAKIKVVLTEEAYTSKASFVDFDPLPPYVKDVEQGPWSGRRVNRGLYKTKDRIIVNADCNGSGNIGRKVIRNEELVLKLGMSVVATPRRVNPLKVFCV